jgi:hypothetical protein
LAACPTYPPATAPTAAPTNAGSYLPIITVNGGNVLTVEASHTGKYVDEGATCTDSIYGMQNVTTAGSVDLADNRGAPHIIEYTCFNPEGSMDTALRFVFVRDTTCPHCYLHDERSSVSVEASFPFDPNSVGYCNDTFAAVTAHVKGAVDVEAVGTYILEYTATDYSGNTDNSCGDYTTTLMTVTVIDTLKPVIALSVNKEVLHVGETGDVSSSQQHFGEANPAEEWRQNQLRQPNQNDFSHVGDSFLAETRTTTVEWVTTRLGSVGMCITAVAALFFRSRRRRTDESRLV